MKDGQPETFEEAVMELAAANRMIQKQKNQLEEDRKVILQIRAELQSTAEKLESQYRYRYGIHSEKLNPEQLCLFKMEDGTPIAGDNRTADAGKESNAEDKSITVKGHKRSRKGKRTYTRNQDLEHVEKYIDISKEEKHCACGHGLAKIGEDRSERIVYVPARIYVEVTVRPKYACRYCEGSGDEDKPVFRQADAPLHMIRKSMAGESLLSHVFTDKFCNHIPYYRQAKMLERLGINLSRQDFIQWQENTYDTIKPLEGIILDYIKSGKVINADETTARVLDYEDGDRTRKKSYVWLAYGGPERQKAVIYSYCRTRNHEHARRFMDGFTGYFQTDFYEGYETALREHHILYPDEGITHVLCMAHLRRRFEDAYKCGSEREAGIALKYIQEIYNIERILREKKLEKEDFIRQRKERVMPVLKSMYVWLLEKVGTVVRTLKFGKAVYYALSIWDKMLNYLECAELTPDNNQAENHIRPVCLGRRNWMFFGNENGARSSCLMYTLIENARISGLNPEKYLEYLFNKAPYCITEDDWKQVLPWNVKLGV